MVAIRFAEDLTRHHGDMLLFQHGLTKVPARHAAIRNAGKEIKCSTRRGQLYIGTLAQCLGPEGVPFRKGSTHFGHPFEPQRIAREFVIDHAQC